MEVILLILLGAAVLWAASKLSHSPKNQNKYRYSARPRYKPRKTLPPKFHPNSSHISNRKPTPKPVKKVDHPPPPPIPLSMKIMGRAWVIDGDTIVVNKVKIRLAGIDAPELDQPWGQKSKWEMVRLCKGQSITVELTGETSYDRLVGTCYLPDGRDLGAEIIKAGLALDGWQFSEGKYRHLECPDMRRKLKRFGNWR